MRDRVTDYAQRVCAGDVTAGRLHRLACQRHLDDLKRQRTDAFPYYWDSAAASDVLDYAETLTIAEGAVPKPLRLLDCQAFDIGCTFGWKKCSNGMRRFRQRYKSISRQQGKSMENGILGTYIAGFSGYRFGQLYTAAPKKRQSKIAWKEMMKFIKADSDLLALFKIQEYKLLITALETDCTIEALSRESGLDDGFRPLFASIDELHQMRDNSIYSALYNGTRSLPETLISMITTRGKSLNSYCYEIDSYARSILLGVFQADDYFVDIYCMDEDDDIWDEKNWPKCCPFACADPERLQTLREDARKARDKGGSDLAEFLTKGLNLWVKNTDNSFVDPEKWKACGTDTPLADVAAASPRCYVGIDLSSKSDLTSIALEFPMEDGRYHIYSHSFMPRGSLVEHQETDLAPYELWEQMGLLTVTGGEMDFMNDYSFIIDYLHKMQDQLGLEFLGIGVDPHNASAFMQDLEAFGCPVVTITQSARNLNDATEEIRLLVRSGRLCYDRSNELLSWSFLNAAVVKNSFGEIKVDKRRKNGHKDDPKRIDPIDAVIDAHYLVLLQPEGSGDLDDGLSAYLEMMGWGDKS